MIMTKDEFLLRFQSLSPTQYQHHRPLSKVQSSPRPLRDAAVLIGLVEREQQLQLVLTRRADHLKHHPGQVSFPGGKVEEHDLDVAETALRETHEELGIPPHKINVIGALPSLNTVSSFSVVPVVAFIDASYQPIIDENEVAELFEVPASFILSPDALGSYSVTHKGVSHTIYGALFEQQFIWGVTAQILHALQRQLSI
jgi:8-oxo-dGTP pyrophosphatase MutT (NUDIX family)